MPYATKYQVVFNNNPRGFFYSGDLITGTAIVETCVGKVIRGTFVTILGVARIKFEEDLSGVTPGNYKIFSDTIPVLHRDDDRYFVLPPGTYRYNFEYKLPDNLPSSFYGKYGFINYVVAITLDENKREYSFKTPFIVMKAINYSKSSELKPIVAHQSKDVSPWYCVVVQHLQVTVKAPTMDFVPGQIIYVVVKIDNYSSRKIRHIDFKLTKSIEYCRRPHQTLRRYEFIVITKKTISGEDLSGKTYVQGIEVPVTQPTSIEDHNLINFRYSININVKVPMYFKDDLEFILPVTISSYKGDTIRGSKKLIYGPSIPCVEDVRTIDLLKNSKKSTKPISMGLSLPHFIKEQPHPSQPKKDFTTTDINPFINNNLPQDNDPIYTISGMTLGQYLIKERLSEI